MSYSLRAENITKRFANHTALDRVSIIVPEGSIFGLLGPNGAGKTTLIRIINMITAPDEGEVFFGNEKLRTEHASLIGYLPEERGLYKKMKVGEQALYLAQLKGLPKKESLRKLKYWFERFEIEEWWGRKVEELSKGMQQKVQFMITILHEPRLLIFDEPFSGFDPINVNILKDEIFSLQKKGATIIFSTHNMSSVEELCDNIALINKSKKILEGEVKQIRSRFRTNIYEIEFANSNADINEMLNGEYRLIEQEQEGGLIKARIKIPQDRSSNNLLEKFISNSTVHSFREILPTMNEIFISMVEADCQ
jgi:ABC-2 type transport system ATP-binding protein